MKWSKKVICSAILLTLLLYGGQIRAGTNESLFKVTSTHSFNVKDTDLADFLRLIARTYGVNLLYQNIEKRKITVSLENVSVNELLNFIMKDQKLDYIKSGSIVKLFPRKEKIKSTYEVKQGPGGNNITARLKDVPLEEFCRKISELDGINATCSPDVRTHLVTATATKVIPADFLKLIAAQEGLDLTQEKGFFQFGKAEAGSTPAKNQIIKIDELQDGAFYTLTAQNAPLDRVCEHLFQFFKLSFVFVDRPTGPVTLKVTSDRFESLLQSLMMGTKYTYYLKDKVFHIGSKGSKGMNDTELLGLSHIDIKGALDAIPANLKKELSITAVDTQDSLLVSGAVDKIHELKDIISSIDLPTAQVLIEVLVVDFKRTDLSEFGLNVSNGQNSFFPGLDVSLEGNRDANGHWQITRLPSNFMMQVHALAQQGVVRIISKPHIATLNGKEASIKVGEKKFYKVRTELMYGELSPQTRTTEKIESIEASISLKIKPYVTASGEVSVDIEPDFNTFLGDVVDNVPPPIDYRTLKSTVRLKDGQTVILGGLIQETMRRTYKGLPFISKIPIIGHLFKNHEKHKDDAELVIYITPHVYYGSEGSAKIISHDEGLAYNLDVKTQTEKGKNEGKQTDTGPVSKPAGVVRSK